MNNSTWIKTVINYLEKNNRSWIHCSKCHCQLHRNQDTWTCPVCNQTILLEEIIESIQVERIQND